jgi:predicted amidohydrolase
MSDKEGCFVCEIDLDYEDKVRGNMACLTHRRKEIYWNTHIINTYFCNI